MTDGNLHLDACDHCGVAITPETLGFATADTVLCSDCAEKAAEKAPAFTHDLGGEG